MNNPSLESQQLQENLPNKINQITLNDSGNVEQALDSLKFSHPYSTSRKSDKEISACKEAKEIIPNAKGNLIELLRNKLTGEARRYIIGNYYNNLKDFISKLKTIFSPSKTVYQLEDVGRIRKTNRKSR